MGRKGDTPDLQAAKGYPGRRKSRVEKRVQSQAELAAAISSAPLTGSNPLAPPAFMDERWAGAIAVWKQMAPSLQPLRRLAPEWRYTFAMLCVYVAEWIECSKELIDKGPTQRIKTISGSFREVDRPAVRRRETAQRNIEFYIKEFGLAPGSHYALLRDQGHVGQNDLFGPSAPQNTREIPQGGLAPGGSSPGDDMPAAPISALGALAAANSRPPDDLLN